MIRKPLNIIVLISGNGSNLQAIIDNATNVSIKAVISNKADAYGLKRAERAGIPTHVVQADSHPERASYDRALWQVCQSYQPDLLVLAGFMRILGPEFIAHFPNRIVNIHPSLLPKYPGLDTHQRVLDAKETTHGVSIHFVTDVLDAGPLIAQAAIKVRNEDTPTTLQNRIHALEHAMYPRILSTIGHQIPIDARLSR